MKRKLLLLFLCFSFVFVPSVKADLQVNFFNLSVINNSIGGDAVFNFHFRNADLLDEDSEDFQIPTQNGVGLYSLTRGAFLVEYNLTQDSLPGWKLDNVGCVSEDPQVPFTPIFKGVRITLTPSVFSTSTCTFFNIKQSNSKTPVLIVPGVLGTDISKGSDKLWLNLSQMSTDVGDDFMDPLQFKKDLSPLDSSLTQGDVVRKPSILFDYTQGLIEEFTNQGYTEGTSSEASLFTFPYDWRYGVSGIIDQSTGKSNVDLLKEKIDSILLQTGASKVDIVAHSTGGLLVKKYVMGSESSHHIGKAVFVGVPNLGAPKALKVLLEGDGFGVPWLADGEMQKIAQNLPVVYDLAPSDKYFGQKIAPIKIISGKFFKDKEKELNFQETKDYLINDKKLNSLALENAHSLHTTSFDNFDLRTAGVDLYNIVGCKTGTVPQIWDFQKPDGKHVRYDLADSQPGDGTVPLESATNLPVDQSHKYFALKADHGKMPSQDGIRQIIVSAISGSSLDAGDSITQDISKCKLKGKAISVFSPLDIEVIDQDGNRMGVASDGSLENNIPQADFNFSEEHKFLYLPDEDGQVYTIKVTGTDSGVFTLKVKDIDNQVQSTAVFANVPVNVNLTGNLFLSSGLLRLELDTNNNGVVDEILYPNILDQNQSLDNFSPTTKSEISGNKDVGGGFIGNAKINLLAQEEVIEGRENEAAGILETFYRLDNGAWQEASSTFSSLFLNSTSTLPEITAFGEHKVDFYSIDRAGNVEDAQQSIFSVVSQPLPLPSGGGGGGGGVYLERIIKPVATSTKAVLLEPLKPVGQVLGSAIYAFPRNLRFGFRGDDVLQLQKFLNNHGFILAKRGPGSLGKETKYFGPLTRAALIKFQKQSGLEPSGRLDDNTRGYIRFLTW